MGQQRSGICGACDRIPWCAGALVLWQEVEGKESVCGWERVVIDIDRGGMYQNRKSFDGPGKGCSQSERTSMPTTTTVILLEDVRSTRARPHIHPTIQPAAGRHSLAPGRWFQWLSGSRIPSSCAYRRHEVAAVRNLSISSGTMAWPGGPHRSYR